MGREIESCQSGSFLSLCHPKDKPLSFHLLSPTKIQSDNRPEDVSFLARPELLRVDAEPRRWAGPHSASKVTGSRFFETISGGIS
jgi:hypothetical protein